MPINSLELETHGWAVEGTQFEVDKRYNIIKPLNEPLNSASYGFLCSAEDKELDEHVSIKKIESVFEHITITKRTLRELRILKHLQHENLMQVKNILITGTKDEYEEIYVVSELMETDLGSNLRSSIPLSDAHCQFFLYQILRGMKYVHSAEVIHRDLKPRNLLVNCNCDLKICDFGSARVRFSNRDWVCPMTEYVGTRWYRAPEVLCSWSDYSAAVDVWSIGCILAEMTTRKTVFAGHNTQHQFDLIIKMLGTPAREALEKIANEKCRRFMQEMKPKAPTPFEVALPDMAPDARTLLEKMLRWDPDSRIDVFEAIQEPYLAELHCPEDEPMREPLDTSDFEFERRRITVAQLREEIFREALCYYPELLEQYDKEAQEAGTCRLLPFYDSGESSDDDDEDTVH